MLSRHGAGFSTSKRRYGDTRGGIVMRIVVLRRPDDTRPAAVVSTEPRWVACQGTWGSRKRSFASRAGCRYRLVPCGPVRRVLRVLPTARLSALVRLMPTGRNRPVSPMLRGLPERCRGESPAPSPGPAGCTAHTGRPFHARLANGWGLRLSIGRSPPGLPILIPSYRSSPGHGRAQSRTAAWLGRRYVVVP